MKMVSNCCGVSGELIDELQICPSCKEHCGLVPEDAELAWEEQNKQIESLQQQLAEQREAHANLARHHAEIEQERDKLQGLVGAWHNYFKKIGKQVLEHDPQQKTHIGGLVSQALALSLDNLPRFVPEEKVKDLVTALEIAKDGFKSIEESAADSSDTAYCPSLEIAAKYYLDKLEDALSTFQRKERG